MMESKSDYLHSLNRKLSDLFYNLPNHDQPNPTNPTMSVYSPLRKTERHRDIAAANSRGYAKPEDKNLNESQSSRSSKGVILNVSQLDNVDHDRFFENFDKIFRVHQSAGGESVDLEEAMKKKNICRVLLDDFEPGRLSPTMGYTSDLFHPERSLTGFTNKEKVLPKLEHVPSKPYLGVKTEPSMSDIAVPYKTADYKETSKEPVCERVKFEFPTSKPVKDKLPDLKVPKAVINKLNSTGGEIPLKSYDNKVHNNVKAIGKVRVNVQAHEGVNVKNKNSHQALEKIVKPKKLTNITRSKTFVLVEGKDKGHDDMKARVNSIHGIDNGLKSTGASQKSDTSLDMGPGTKSKFFLKGLEQKVTHPNIYNQENVGNKTQNEVKNGRNNVTSRTYYSKENLSFLSNSSRDKAFEGNQLKVIRETGNMAGRAIESTGHGPSNFNGHTVKMGVEEISRLYKDLRQSIKLNETQTQKFTQGMRTGSNSLKPLNEEYNDNIRRG